MKKRCASCLWMGLLAALLFVVVGAGNASAKLTFDKLDSGTPAGWTAAVLSTPGSNDCCQCDGAVPACGPPVSGACGTGADGTPCTPVFDASCNGVTGSCVAHTPTSTPTFTPTQTPTRTQTPTSTPGVPGPTPAPFENAAGPQACSDGIDNDLNGLTDCQDPRCFGVAPCPANVPVVSAPLGVVLAGGLTLAGLLALARSRKRSR